jgi:transcription-repair coupling factor (superfamily II helicase)
LIPDATIEFAHGQMSERELEHIMLDFVNGEIDVLVSTTIIETGLDIANTNTIIIHDADRMGLSQLYQLRGRVGRSNRIAYAYLMYKKDKVLDEVATKRLQAIREFTEFGAGFKIAMRDLEIRGAGNILGTSQSGSMDAVGYDLYCKMLEQAVNQLSDKPMAKKLEVTIDVNIDAYLPSDYIMDEVRKIESYKKIATIRHEEDYQDMLDELLDRYGEPRQAVINLLDIALIKGMAAKAHIIDIKQKGFKFILEVKADAPINPIKIPTLIEKSKKRLKFTVHERPHFTYEIDMTAKGTELAQLKVLIEQIKELEG